jgi:membrane-associated PAP2 superfamily phosphatase
VARLGLLVALLAGGVLGTVRMLQGAHFLSHTLWTLWLAWALSVTLALLVHADLAPGRRAPAVSP